MQKQVAQSPWCWDSAVLPCRDSVGCINHKGIIRNQKPQSRKDGDSALPAFSYGRWKNHGPWRADSRCATSQRGSAFLVQVILPSHTKRT
jgi:hypothetical protein